MAIETDQEISNFFETCNELISQYIDVFKNCGIYSRDERDAIGESFRVVISNLISRVPQVNSYLEDLINIQDEGGHNLLFLSTLQDMRDTALFLLSIGANPNLANEKGAYPIHLAVKNGDLELVEILYQKGASLDVALSNGITPLIIALNTKNLRIAEFLVLNNADVNLTGAANNSPLSEAIENDYDDFAKKLIDRGADVNSKVNDVPVLIACIIKGKTDLAKYMIDNGAKIEIANTDEGINVIHIAAQTKAHEILFYMIEKIKNDQFFKENQIFLLHQSIESRNFELLEYLLKIRVNPNLQDDKLFSLLHYATVKKNYEAAEILIKNRAEIDAQSDNGIRPIHISIELNDIKTTKLLIDNGAAIDTVGELRLSPLIFAISNDSVEFIELFAERNCNFDFLISKDFYAKDKILKDKSEIIKSYVNIGIFFDKFFKNHDDVSLLSIREEQKIEYKNFITKIFKGKLSAAIIKSDFNEYVSIIEKIKSFDEEFFKSINIENFNMAFIENFILHKELLKQGQQIQFDDDKFFKFNEVKISAEESAKSFLDLKNSIYDGNFILSDEIFSNLYNAHNLTFLDFNCYSLKLVEMAGMSACDYGEEVS